MRGIPITRGLVSVVICLITNVTFGEANNPGSKHGEEYQRQIDIYYEQTRKVDEQQAETDRQLKEAASLQEVTAKQLERSRLQAERMERLLERWEAQADRYDKLLEQWESQTKQQPVR